MPNMPAFCDKCGAIFPSGFYIKDSQGTFEGCTSMCPRCGSMAKVPDGMYNVIGETIEILKAPDVTIEKLKALNELLYNLKSDKIKTDTFEDKVNTELPELSSLVSILPKNRTDLYAFLGLIIAFIQMIISLNAKEPINNYNIDTVINNYYISEPINSNNSIVKPGMEIKKKQNIVEKKVKIGRNEPCPCGSGKKYKKCCNEK
ncbi:SEC-C metal-binding domain-containing protein [Clostridium intestinale]|uniref:SEC-C metal-binding domain-containing protein n=1 Tax=Clostridium intestinale TaxID=36845 RepID=UPI001FAD3EF5|nr:SEC-C metal-binding domain-containing protein [Clostridium intestinale]